MVSILQPRTPTDEEYCSWGVVLALAVVALMLAALAKVAEATARMVMNWEGNVEAVRSVRRGDCEGEGAQKWDWDLDGKGVACLTGVSELAVWKKRA